MMFPLVRNSPIARAINSFEWRNSVPRDCTFPLPYDTNTFRRYVQVYVGGDLVLLRQAGRDFDHLLSVERSVGVGYVAELIGLLFLPTFDVEDE